MNATETRLIEQLSSLRLLTVQEHYAALASEAAQKQWTHVDYLARLIEGEAQRRQELAIQRRIAGARFPCIAPARRSRSHRAARAPSPTNAAHYE